MMETLFWSAVLTVAYVYAGYPLVLAIWSRAAARPVRKRMPPSSAWPSVSVVIAARNEASRLPRRVRNLLRQDYPGPVEIVVVSDGSGDDSREALAAFADSVRFVAQPRDGKASALNAGVNASSGAILVFADARQRFAPDAIRQLIANFADPEVGGVTGELVLDCEDESEPPGGVSEGVGRYWRYEKWLRRRESDVWSTLGATGAIYALRRDAWHPLPPGTLLDDVLAPMRVVLAGQRVVFDETARAFDRASRDAATETRRKTRTLAGNYQILAREPRLLLPFVNPVWVQYLSHKIGRLLVPWALIAIFISSAVLAPQRWFYAVALIVQLTFYGLAGLGAWMERRKGSTACVDELTQRATRGSTSASGA